ncbi:hypothetical protein ANCCEY_05286 [Ancylostoma ceylanicum]|uniref:Endonuclease/exonuclease/phosphatase domain-containing protein n=1 Tax=Ancylostoma ceylanicum TaxID=53326 RepID=A0A0D6M6T3_9BILA|nr:hypothetical protein ANCCEY_05286 [Ancylostoma ceylanicum]
MNFPVHTGVFFDPSMTSQSGRVLLITANVGSLFEQDQRLQEAWLKTFTERINQEMADIVVIHMQETGGKQLGLIPQRSGSVIYLFIMVATLLMDCITASTVAVLEELTFHKTLDFVNVHLFHDESNLALIHENPFLYSSNRKRALDYVLEQLMASGNWESSPCFIFGDLNFRLDSTSFLNIKLKI